MKRPTVVAFLLFVLSFFGFAGICHAEDVSRYIVKDVADIALTQALVIYGKVRRYRNRISGPLLDRIDIQVDVLRPKFSLLRAPQEAPEDSATVRQRVSTAGKLQLQRAGRPNALLDNEQMKQFCGIGEDSLQLLEQAVQQFYLSPRARHRILKVPRTIADPALVPSITPENVAEAAALRQLSNRSE